MKYDSDPGSSDRHTLRLPISSIKVGISGTHVHLCMTRRVKRNCDVLKVLAKCKPHMRRAIIKAADKDLLEAITECFFNICKYTIKIIPKTTKDLHRTQIISRLLLISASPLHNERELFYKRETDSCLSFLLLS